MAHLSPKSFSSEGVLGRHQPYPKILECTTNFFFLGLFFDSDIFVMD